MAYRIEYGSEIRQKPIKQKLSHRFWALTFGFFLVFILYASVFCQQELATLRDTFLPDRQALQTLISDLQQGEDFSEAIDAFCRELIGHGG